MSSKLFGAFCLAAMLALAMCKGAVVPAYADNTNQTHTFSSPEEEKAFDEYVLVLAGFNICQFTFEPYIIDKVTTDVTKYGRSIDDVNRYANEEIIKLMMALPYIGVSQDDFCQFLYRELAKRYN